MTPPSLQDAVGRLTELAAMFDKNAVEFSGIPPLVGEMHRRATDLRLALSALVEMRGALEPFAETTIRDDLPEDQAVIGYADIVFLTVGDFRRARQALQQKESAK